MPPVEAAINTVGRAFGSMPAASMPPLSRGLYRRELTAWLFLPIMMGAVEGGVTGVIAKNAFSGHVPETWLNVAVAILTGAGAIASVTSFLWAALAHGQPKIRFLVRLQLVTVVLVGQFAIAPRNTVGLLMLVAAGLGARICWAGVVTIRSTVWRANYPQHARATLAGRLVAVQSIMLAGVGLAIAWTMERNAASLPWLYAGAAACGLVGAVLYGRVRMRGHAALLRDERRGGMRAAASNPMQMVRVLREDPAYRWYMVWMFVFGIGNIAVTAPVVLMLKDLFGYGYLAGIVITTCIPIGVMRLAIPLWARLFDGIHVLQYRVWHAWSFVVGNVAYVLAAITEEPALMWIGAVFQGIAFGGGVLAWNLGHHDYAPLERASQYMGVHVTLTGVRGLIAPLAAVALYNVSGGAPVLALCVVLNLAGAAGFYFLNRRRLRGLES